MDPIFAIPAALALLSGVMMVTRRNPVYSAVWLLVTFLCVAVLFLALSAPFLASIHILVYTGAILVLFLFVIMLLNLKDSELGQEYPVSVRLGVAGMCVALYGALAWPIVQDGRLSVDLPTASPAHGSVEQVGQQLFTTYALQFELVSVLIIVAMFGAMILAKKKMWAS
ncbi:MAG: NADH-quinone oxidoreductase subunit J [Myxococcota bacterium]